MAAAHVVMPPFQQFLAHQQTHLADIVGGLLWQLECKAKLFE